MRVYFVRHGETKSNISGIHQGANEGLSLRGHEQAQFLAKRFSEVSIDLIYSSPFKRTQETTEHIAKEIHKDVVFSDLITEVKLPSEIEGTERKNPETAAIRQLVRDHFYDAGWHYSDEENFEDIKKRAVLFVEELERSGKESVLVVTHGGIMLMIILVMKFKDSLTADLFHSMQSFFHINNTGITLMDNSWDGNWWLISWNDHGHLGYFYK